MKKYIKQLKIKIEKKIKMLFDKAENEILREYILEKSKRPDGRALFIANIERAKESLRVLEETSKLLNPKLGILYKKIRFRVYLSMGNPYMNRMILSPGLEQTGTRYRKLMIR